ncbi:MAG: alpha/beta hydrolase [Holophagaceae bacterium]|nr:alpha/beta hydrolase [Holophagaceae bacterium]
MMKLPHLLRSILGAAICFTLAASPERATPLRVSYSLKRDPTHFIEGTPQFVEGGKSMDARELKKEITEARQQHPDRPWIIFIHGFNSTNQESMAKLTALKGPFADANLLLLEWPSGDLRGLGVEVAKPLIASWSFEGGGAAVAEARDYVQACMSRAKQAALLFEGPLADLLDSMGPRIALGAHSMGAEVYSHLIRKGFNRKFQTVVLLAPCTNAPDFEAAFGSLPTEGRSLLTVFCSSTDKVLGSAHLAFVKQEPKWMDERVLGSCWRSRANYEYDLINITCVYDVEPSFLAHWPDDNAKPFYEDFERALEGKPVYLSSTHVPVSFMYQTFSRRAGGIEDSHWRLRNLMLNLVSGTGPLCGKLPVHWYNWHDAQLRDPAIYLKYKSARP